MNTPKQFVPGSALTASVVTYYTVPSSSKSETIRYINVCNTDTVSRTVTIYVVPPGGSAGVASARFYQMSLQPNETKQAAPSDVMLAGATIQALASSAGVVSLAVSGFATT